MSESKAAVGLVGPTTIPEAHEFYTAYALPVTPVTASGKEGFEEGWSKPGYNATLEKFIGPRNGMRNIGVLNGTRVHRAEPKGDFFFHDVDLDAKTPEALRIMEKLLPPTGWVYGRAGNPRSHRNYLVKGTALHTKRHGGLHGNIIELRGLSKMGTHTLSVAPGSTHKSSEKILFVEPLRKIGEIEDPEALDQGVRHVAVAIVVQQDWPASGRHNLRLAYAKVLIESGVPKEKVIEILEAVMEVTGSDVADVRPSVATTVEAMKAGHAAGASTIKDVLGDDVGGKILLTIAKLLRSEVVDFGEGIVMTPGERPQIVDRAIEILSHSNIEIYQRGGQLVHVLKIPTAEAITKEQIERGQAASGSVRRQEGATVLRSVNVSWLLDKLGRVTRWFDATHRRADPKPAYATTIIERGEWPFPVLRSFVTAPTMTFDGRIIEEPGLDVRSGIYVDVTPGTYRPIPVNPTKDDAIAALEFFVRPLRGFPFINDASRSVARAAMLTALVRASLRTAPLHGFDAPAAGTGKSLLAEIAGLLATGVRPAALSQGKSPEEDEKRLATVLFAGDPVIHIDNCEREITGDFLCSMLTQETVQARILGFSERRVLPSTALVLASGNNLVLAGDTSRRGVMCRLDARVEQPEKRPFNFDCHAEVLATRRDLVVAGLTILRAYVVAGKPEKLTPMGGFNDWEWVRGALVWLGCDDPADTQSAISESDPKKDELSSVMDIWHPMFGEEWIGVSRINEHGENPLKDKFIEVACRGGAWSSQKVGYWLSRHKDRVVGDRAFKFRPTPEKQKEWRLELAQRRLTETDEMGRE
jgi:hypothetical protein